ncbi:Outer membrane efflux protein [Stieleria magnilauensis]|uniref:Outer membrane efflux protein n=1 Tax=Stieleria magnilauensis TaxID=2527963 RepID=A0ABX5XS20_9BACT|nr:Outer membrane efflux protein [Planctomycetes bacterium TBK1r]
MRMHQDRTLSRSRKRQFLALSLIACSAGGCASGPARTSLVRHTSTPTVAASAVSQVVADTPKSPASGGDPGVAPVGYNDFPLTSNRDSHGLVFAAPVMLTAEEPDEGVDENPFGKLLKEVEDLEDEELGVRSNERREERSEDDKADESDSDTDSNDENEAEAGSESAPNSPLPTPNSQLATGQPVEYFVQQALAAHPSIRAARQRVAAELDRIPQVTALPDPQFNNTFWPLHDNALQTAGGRIANQMSLQQGVPFPDKLRTKGAIVSREAQMAQAEVERIERQITESVRLAYYEVWYATRAIQIIEETRDLVDDLTKVAEARYRSGGTQQDVLRAQLETDRLDDQLIQLQKQKEVSQADLAALLQQPTSLLAEATEELGVNDAPLQLDALIAQAEQCNPSLRGLAAEIQRDRQKQRLACLQQYPDFMVGLNWGIVSDGHDVISPVANGNDNLSITFGTTLPIWREKINAGVREANRRTSSTTQRLEAERDEIYGRLRRLLAQADSLVEQTDIYEDRIIPRAEDTLKLAIADYRGERTDFFTLIETYRELLMFEIQLARINATLAGTIAQIDRTVGCPF